MTTATATTRKTYPTSTARSCGSIPFPGTPDGNPVFADHPDADPHIWAYGLRNPFRFTFTPDGELLVGDVGNSTWEELNLVVKGGNYGWPNAEGPCEGCDSIDPIYAYRHTAATALQGAITSVLVYTGDTYPDRYRNKVFIADYTQGWIKELTFDAEYTTLLGERTFDNQAGTAVKLLQGPDGNIYQLNIYPGELSRIAPSDGNRAPTAVLTATPSNGYAPLEVHFSSAGSSDPDPGTTLSYVWDFGDDTTSIDANPVKTYVANGTYTVTLTVSDGAETGQATQTITVGSTAPRIDTMSPTDGTLYNAGDVISLSATAFDDEDGALADEAYEWTVVFHHLEHVHPFEESIIGSTATVTIPRDPHNEETTWYRVTLTVTDSSGLSTSRTVDIKPRLVNLTFDTSDPEAKYTIDGIPRTGTYTERGVVGVERLLAAPSPQVVSDGTLVFVGWQDENGVLLEEGAIVTPDTDATYTAVFTKVATVI
ncbi:PKD domain-containing protein [Mycolicibacterium elephantis]